MSEEFNNHSICIDWRLSSDHAPLTVKISIFEEIVQTKKYTIVKNNKEEHNFVVDVKNLIRGLNTFQIDSKEDLENVVQEFANNTNNIWFKHSKLVNITRHLKSYRMKNIKFLQRLMEIQDDWTIEKVLRKQSKFQNKNFLIVRYKKS